MSFEKTPPRFDFANLAREIPLGVRLRLRIGGLLNQLGWGLLGVGMIFFWIFAAQADITGWYVFQEPLVQVPGKVLTSERTSYSSGKSRRTQGSPNRIYAHHYEFTAADGVRRTGTSYARGAKEIVGQQVTIEHPLDDPEHSRIQNMRSMPLDAAAAFTALIPSIALVMLVIGYGRSRKSLRLLAVGKLAAAEPCGRKSTNWKVNSRPVYELKFSFAADDGIKHTKSIRTHQPELYEGRHNVLLYNPGNPADADFLQRMSGRPQIDARGEITLPTSGRTWLIMFLPTVAILGNGAYLLSRVLAI